MDKAMANLVNLPKDLTPAQRAQLKLVKHAVTIAVLNSLVAGLMWLSNASQVNWKTFGLVVLVQLVWGILDAANKYASAQHDVPLSMLVAYGEMQAQAHLPPLVDVQPAKAGETPATSSAEK